MFCPSGRSVRPSLSRSFSFSHRKEFLQLYQGQLEALVDLTAPQLKEYNLDQLVLLLEIAHSLSAQLNIDRLLPGFERR